MRAETKDYSHPVYSSLLDYFGVHFPTVNLRSWMTHPGLKDSSIPLALRGTFFEHVIVTQEKYKAFNWTFDTRDALLCVRLSPTKTWVGELQDIFVHKQAAFHDMQYFSFVRWLKPFHAPDAVIRTVWEPRYVPIFSSGTLNPEMVHSVSK